MKIEEVTINIPQSIYDNLLDIAKEYVTQDKRHQAEPCMFTPRSYVWEITCENQSDEHYWLDVYSGDFASFNDEEAQQWCQENNYYFDENEDFLGDMVKGYYLEKNYRTRRKTFENRGCINPFFTSKYCDIYIHNDRHNLEDKNAKSYAFTPVKNFEMDTIAKLLTYLGKNL